MRTRFDQLGKKIGLSALGLSGLTTFWEQRARNARKANPGEPFVAPFLWIVAAGRSDAVLASLEKARRPGWLEKAVVAESVAEVIDEPS
jgi:hypothetical protein